MRDYGMEELANAQHSWEQAHLTHGEDIFGHGLTAADLPPKPLYAPLDTAGVSLSVVDMSIAAVLLFPHNGQRPAHP